MRIDTNQIVSITEANQNFSRVARMAEQGGSVLIFKSNRPKFILKDFESEPGMQLSEEELIDVAAARILKRYRRAFEVLAQ